MLSNKALNHYLSESWSDSLCLLHESLQGRSETTASKWDVLCLSSYWDLPSLKIIFVTEKANAVSSQQV